MTTIFKDSNQAVNYYANKLLEASPVISTNQANSERYKNLIGGEVIQEYFKIEDPKKIINTWDNHKGHKWWTYAEIISEMLNLDPPIMYKYKPELFSQHYDLLQDGRMQYTYSNRFVEYSQFINLYRRLKDNPNSKRGVIDIFTPYDTAPERNDVPCTTMYHFIQRDGKLNMSVFYRSWDFFGGFKTYDLALTSFIQQSFCNWLGFETGDLGVYVNSLHYYNRDRSKLESLVEEVNSTHKDSDSLELDGKLGIEETYNQLRIVKAVEEAAYNDNLLKAQDLRGTLKSNLLIDMANVWINKNFNGAKK